MVDENLWVEKGLNASFIILIPKKKKKKKPIASNSRVLAKYFGGKLLQNPSGVGQPVEVCCGKANF